VLRLFGTLVVGLVVVIVALTAFSALMRVQSRTLPAVTGPSAVGRTEIALTDAGRPDPFAADGRARELAVWIWYPAVAGSAGAAAPYLPAAWAPLVNNEWAFFQDYNAVHTNSIADAPLDGSPPVVVLMPGLGLPVASYSALAEDLASHGYAVVGINPTESIDVVFPDGHLVTATPLGNVAGADVASWYASAARVTEVWAADAAFVVTTLAASPPQVGAFDFSHVAYLGHSLGGAASFEACRQDSRCATAVDLDGTLWTEVRHTGLVVPNLILRAAPKDPCDEFCRAAAVDFETVDAVGNSQQLAIAGSKHMNYSDVGLMWAPVDSLVVLGTIDQSRMNVITRDAVRSFLDENVRGAPADSFASTVAQYPEVR
jgi:dienelactone hydrolase